MGKCHHYSGGICVVCHKSTNSCCGNDYGCGKCHNEVCDDCYDEKNKCPVCTKQIVTDEKLLEYIIQKYKINKEEEIQHYKKS